MLHPNLYSSNSNDRRVSALNLSVLEVHTRVSIRAECVSDVRYASLRCDPEPMKYAALLCIYCEMICITAGLRRSMTVGRQSGETMRYTHQCAELPFCPSFDLCGGCCSVIMTARAESLSRMSRRSLAVRTRLAIIDRYDSKCVCSMC